ncbi:rCG25721 [Rattus norvegicus]|uniref:RCG25721 n=1 Tax=Rattus norvegicus TaxID=10116 RepID=A6I1M5_RAT|nr:rCG25721 [Rattus norvegicus]
MKRRKLKLLLDCMATVHTGLKVQQWQWIKRFHANKPFTLHLPLTFTSSKLQVPMLLLMLK